MDISENLPIETLKKIKADIELQLSEQEPVQITVSPLPDGYNLPNQQFLLVLMEESKQNELLELTLEAPLSLPLLEPVANRVMETQ